MPKSSKVYVKYIYCGAVIFTRTQGCSVLVRTDSFTYRAWSYLDVHRKFHRENSLSLQNVERVQRTFLMNFSFKLDICHYCYTFNWLYFNYLHRYHQKIKTFFTQNYIKSCLNKWVVVKVTNTFLFRKIMSSHPMKITRYLGERFSGSNSIKILLLFTIDSNNSLNWICQGRRIMWIMESPVIGIKRISIRT